MTKNIMVVFSKHEFRELTKGQSQPHTASECRRLATALYSIGIADRMAKIYSHAHHDDPQRNFRDYFLTIDLSVCSFSNLLGQ